MQKMSDKEKMRLVCDVLRASVRDDCALEFEDDPWKLAVMARLSAQCRDERVNEVCRELFKKYPDAPSLADAELADIERIIKPCGLFRSKASNIREMSAIIVEKHGGKVPSDMDALLEMPGIGRKIANLIRGDLYGLGGIVADTHCIRICGRLGFYPETLKDAVKVEKILTPLVQTEEQTALCHRLVWFGRLVCDARLPKCESCPLSHICDHVGHTDHT